MLIVVLVVLCVASLAAAVLQTMRLRTLQQKMDALRQNGRDAQIVLESIAGHGRPGTATAGYEGCVW